MTLRQRNRPTSTVPLSQTVAPLGTLSTSGTTNLSPTSPLTPLTPRPLTPELLTTRSMASAPMIFRDAGAAKASFMYGPLTPQPPTPTPMIDQDQIAIFQLEVQRVEDRSRAPTPIIYTHEPLIPVIDQGVLTAFELEVERFEARSDAVIAEQERALNLVKDKEAVVQENYNSVQERHVKDLEARRKIYECPLCSDLAWDSHVILSKPRHSVAIQAGVKGVAAELFMTALPTEPLQWSY
ncbi:hypothetical protein EV360DRAFT_70363 [Lentinula raphanica]|nr:hypothetical protein EV360DRAFT_70363 [Lentinula raphanica]